MVALYTADPGENPGPSLARALAALIEGEVWTTR
jgi:hypothetical protein